MLLKQTGRYLPAQIGMLLVQLLSVLLWAHILPGAELGKAMLVVAMQDILFALCFVWWSQFMLRHLPGLGQTGREDDVRRTELFVILGCLSAQLIFAVFVCRSYFPDAGAAFYAIAVLFISLKALGSYCAERARALQRVSAYFIIQAFLPAVGLAISLPASEVLGARAEVVLFCAALPLVIAPLLVFTPLPAGKSGLLDARLLRQALAFGLPAAIAALLSALTLNLPRFAVDLWFGHAAAGVFSVAFGLGLRVSTFAVMLVTAGAYPLAIRCMEQEGAAAGFRQLSANIVLVCLVAAPFGLGLVGISRSVIGLLLPTEMREVAAIVLPLAALAGLFRYVRAHTTDQVFLLSSQTRPVAVVGALESGLATLLTPVGLSLFSMPGGALAFLVAVTVSAAVSIVWAGRERRFHFPVFEISRIFFAATVMSLSVYLTGDAGSFLGLGVRIILAACGYLVLLALLFPQTALAFIGRWRVSTDTAGGAR